MTPRNEFGITPFFLPGSRGDLFCLHLSPATQPAKGNILYLHPFAEEMHKSRRMAALQAREFARSGYRVLQADLTGCGDSAGDFGDATWETWRDDGRRAHAWLASNFPGPVLLWGLRTGATLAAELATELPDIVRLLLWQPVASGEQFLNQYLRIKLASEMLGEGQAQTSTKNLLAQLDDGQPVEVGGNMLAPAMARGLQSLKLAEIRPPCPVHWIEAGSESRDGVSPASQRVIDEWQKAGVNVRAHTVKSDPFWSTQEITECPELIKAASGVFADD